MLSKVNYLAKFLIEMCFKVCSKPLKHQATTFAAINIFCLSYDPPIPKAVPTGRKPYFSVDSSITVPSGSPAKIAKSVLLPWYMGVLTYKIQEISPIYRRIIAGMFEALSLFVC